MDIKDFLSKIDRLCVQLKNLAFLPTSNFLRIIVGAHILCSRLYSAYISKVGRLSKVKDEFERCERHFCIIER